MHIPRDVAGGVVLIAVGSAFYFGAAHLRVGTLMNMGPGYFPRAVALLLVAVGVLVLIVGIVNSERIGTAERRPLLAVLAAIGIFALTVRSIGLIPAMFLGVLAASAGDRVSRFWPAFLLAVGAAIGAWLIFRVGLGLQLPGFRIPTWLR